GRAVTQSAHATASGDAAARTALLGEWTVEWWSTGVTGTYPGAMVLSGVGDGTILAYGTISDETANGNTLMQVGFSGGDFFFKWDHGVGVDVTFSVRIAVLI